MRKQTKRLNETPTLSRERSGSVTCHAQYQGYRLTARAEPVRSALHAAHLVIEGPGYPTQRCFHALDHFFDPAQALQYAIRWGRIWVEHRPGGRGWSFMRVWSGGESRLPQDETEREGCGYERFG